MAIDKRPVPNVKEQFFLSDKDCDERLYVYLLLKSKRNDKNSETHRFMSKKSYEEIAADLGMSRQTVGKHMKTLINKGYVIKETKYYKVPKADYYSLIPTDTLDFLLNYIENKERIIKLYIVLFDYYNLKKSFIMKDLHEALGYAMPNNKPISKNSTHIRTLMMLLSEAGLVKYEIKTRTNSKNAEIDEYIITSLKNKIDDKYKESYRRLRASKELEEPH